MSVLFHDPEVPFGHEKRPGRPPELTVAMVVAELVQVEAALPWESVVVQVVVDPSE